MEVFYHHIYEYKKGLRNLILHTANSKLLPLIEKRLERDGISFVIYHVNHEKINVFFGNGVCVDVIRSIDKQCLSEFSNEEDFILGIMLGYDRLRQCKRYMERLQLKFDEVERSG